MLSYANCIVKIRSCRRESSRKIVGSIHDFSYFSLSLSLSLFTTLPLHVDKSPHSAPSPSLSHVLLSVSLALSLSLSFSLSVTALASGVSLGKREGVAPRKVRVPAALLWDASALSTLSEPRKIPTRAERVQRRAAVC